MAPFTFALECPKCSTINTASKSIFGKKVIKCGTCGEEINVKQSTLISKSCPSCSSVFIFDQRKSGDVKCPHCQQVFPRFEAATVQYKKVPVNCPQCGCKFEADKNKPSASCPLCSHTFDLNRELARAELVTDGGISVIQYEGDNSTFVWKHPIEDFNMGSQLIVHESQEALFFMNGEALDLFGPGRYTLDTENIPFLKKLYAVPDGTQTPFHCEVYFINKTVHLGIKWGTPDKVRFLEPTLGLPLDIGASGELSLAVSDPRKLIVKLVGTTGVLKNNDVLNATSEVRTVKNGNETIFAQKSMQSFFRTPLVTGVKSFLAQTINEQQIDIFEIDAHLDDLSIALRDKISPRFEEYGLRIAEFYVSTIVLPEDDPNFKNMRALRTVGLKKKEAEAAAELIESQRQMEIEQKKTELVSKQYDAEIKRVDLQLEAEGTRLQGFAEAEVLAAKGITGKDVLVADVQKAYAEGIGKMGASGGTAGSGIAGEMIGVAAGMNMLNNFNQQFGSIVQPAVPAAEKSQDAWKCVCGHEGNRNKFCEACGKEKPEEWTCECGQTGNLNKFCGSCGKPKPEIWTCSCGHAGNKNNFCEACGKPKTSAGGSWDCTSCGQRGNTGGFCGGCGKPKP